MTKRYFVITHSAIDNQHLNVQDLLPASCKLITGLAVTATAKKPTELTDKTELLSFPQSLMSSLLRSNTVTDLFYSFLRTRSSEAESIAFFNSDILPVISEVLSSNIIYDCLDEGEQQFLSESISNLFNFSFTDYIYNEAMLFEKAGSMSDQEFADYIASQVLLFIYNHKEEVLIRPVKIYQQPEPYECGNISLLVNGNSFLFRDYTVSANRKIRNIEKEIIPFYEPLEVNSNIHTVFKNAKNNGDSTLTIKIYIQYEHK